MTSSNVESMVQQASKKKYVLYSVDAIAATLVRALSVGLPEGGTLGGTIFIWWRPTSNMQSTPRTVKESAIV